MDNVWLKLNFNMDITCCSSQTFNITPVFGPLIVTAHKIYIAHRCYINLCFQCINFVDFTTGRTCSHRMGLSMSPFLYVSVFFTFWFI